MERALDAGCVPVPLLLERKHIAGQAREIIARCEVVPVYTADFEVLTKLTGFQLTRGVLCAMRRPASRSHFLHTSAYPERSANQRILGVVLKITSAKGI